MVAFKEFLKANGWMLLVVALVLGVAYRFVDPAPPTSISVATGPDGGRYHQVALQLRERLAADGLDLILLPSAGSIANLDALADPQSEVSMAFVQSGIDGLYEGDTSGLSGLGSLYYEPLWIFFRRSQPLELIPDLRGRRVAIGAPGSGTNAIARLLLETSHLRYTGADADVAAREVGGSEAAAALVAGEIDAAFFVQSADGPLIAALAVDPGLDFLDMQRAEAYRRRFPFLSTSSIPAGLIDLGRDIPPSDRRVLAPVATLVVNHRFHPALTPLVLEAARSVVGGGGLLEDAGEFPSPQYSDFPLSPEAEHYYRSGPPFLMRYMPFWAASLIDRLIILVLPLMVVVLPLARLAGPIYQWRTRSKIYRWYEYLRGADEKIRNGSIAANVGAEMQHLREIEGELSRVEVPLSYMDQLYNLQLHLSLVLERLQHLEREARGAAEPRP